MELIKGLTTTQTQTLAFFDLAETDLQKTYALGKWNIKQLLHHLADAETVLYDRIRRAIARPNQVVWGFDQDAWADKLQYNQFPLAINKGIYQSVRTATIYLAKEHYERLGENQYVHNQTGIRTLKDEFEKVVWHNEHHLQQIQLALKK